MPRKTDSSNPADWLTLAEADLAMVRLAAEKEVSFGPCRGKLAEAVEKALKAELIRRGWTLERTHDLQRLAKLLDERGSELLPVVRPLASDLAEAYFEDRYPGFDMQDPDWPALHAKIADAGRLLDLIRVNLG